MFWNKKLKLPITEADKEWVDYSLDFLKKSFGQEHFQSITTVRPTKEFYGHQFDHTENDAIFVLERTIELMNIPHPDIDLEFFSDEPIVMADGTTIATSADKDGSWNSTAGLYEETDKKTTIYIEKSQLKDTISLIATIAHELSHEILLGENRIKENDEYLTDLTAIVYGFGIFLGNSKFKSSSFSSTLHQGWNMRTQGYLPEQIIGYAMAKLSIDRNEKLTYDTFMDKSLKKFFLQSVKYIQANDKSS